jgi:hypothetical protein
MGVTGHDVDRAEGQRAEGPHGEVDAVDADAGDAILGVRAAPLGQRLAGLDGDAGQAGGVGQHVTVAVLAAHEEHQVAQDLDVGELERAGELQPDQVGLTPHAVGSDRRGGHRRAG